MSSRRCKVHEPFKLVLDVEDGSQPDYEKIDAAVRALVLILAKAAAEEFVEEELIAARGLNAALDKDT